MPIIWSIRKKANGKCHNDDFRAQENEMSDKLVTWGSIKKPMSMVQLGMLLKKNGFQSKQVGTTRTRGWLVRVRDMEEVNANRNIEGKG